MIKTLIIILLLLLLIYFAHKLFLWMERKGWLYYKNQKSPGGFVGNALLEIHSFFVPSANNVVEVKQNKATVEKIKKNNGKEVNDESK